MPQIGEPKKTTSYLAISETFSANGGGVADSRILEAQATISS